MNKEQKKKLTEKETFLINHGYYKYVFKKEGDDPFEYGLRRLNPETNEFDFCKLVVDDISDEEYEALLNGNIQTNTADNNDDYNLQTQTQNDQLNKEASSNIIATAITIIAVIAFIGAFILGIVYGNTFKIVSLDNSKNEEYFNTVAMFITWGIGAVSGTLLLGFAEIIKLLQKIANK